MTCILVNPPASFTSRNQCDDQIDHAMAWPSSYNSVVAGKHNNTCSACCQRRKKLQGH